MCGLSLSGPRRAGHLRASAGLGRVTGVSRCREFYCFAAFSVGPAPSSGWAAASRRSACCRAWASKSSGRSTLAKGLARHRLRASSVSRLSRARGCGSRGSSFSRPLAGGEPTAGRRSVGLRLPSATGRSDRSRRVGRAFVPMGGRPIVELRPHLSDPELQGIPAVQERGDCVGTSTLSRPGNQCSYRRSSCGLHFTRRLGVRLILVATECAKDDPDAHEVTACTLRRSSSRARFRLEGYQVKMDLRFPVTIIIKADHRPGDPVSSHRLRCVPPLQPEVPVSHLSVVDVRQLPGARDHRTRHLGGDVDCLDVASRSSTYGSRRAPRSSSGSTVSTHRSEYSSGVRRSI